ncbi:uncharacterized protein LOC111261858 isoform X4 [Varroa jacobsoni]|uniref:uncharacterized protein LOC111261858 isoform X4 n=1 Tax=Varroa jacobsoni TaxID=62625 RepID=UPI000BF50DFE|nr:uncharacterized protein LOC111261858 isoform X4 [Varroa jacobsoni]
MCTLYYVLRGVLCWWVPMNDYEELDRVAAIVNPQQQLPNQQTEAFLPQSLLKPLQKGDEQQSVYAKDEASLFHGKHDKTMAGDAKQSGTSENCTDNCYYPRMMAPVRKQAIETKSPVRTEPTYANVDISLCVCCRHNAGSCCDSYHRRSGAGSPLRSPLYTHRHSNSAGGSSDGSGPRPPHRRHQPHHSSGSSLEMDSVHHPIHGGSTHHHFMLQQQQLGHRQDSPGHYGMSQYEQIGGGVLYEGVGQGQVPLRPLQHYPGQQQQFLQTTATQQHLQQQHQSHGEHHHSSSPHKVKELEEARQRITQMEKTMRWWSDCTNNWRDKWSKARAERNEAKEELRRMRTTCEQHTKELESLASERGTLEQEIINLRSEVHRLKEIGERRVVTRGAEGPAGSPLPSRPSPTHTEETTEGNTTPDNTTRSSNNNNNTHALAESLMLDKRRMGDESGSAMAVGDLSLTDNNQMLHNEPEPDGLLDKLDSDASFDLGGASGVILMNANNDVAAGNNLSGGRGGNPGLAEKMSPIDVNGRGGSVSSNEKSFAEELLALNYYGTGSHSGVNPATTGDQDQAKIAYLQLRLQDALRQLANEKQENERLNSNLAVLASGHHEAAAVTVAAAASGTRENGEALSDQIASSTCTEAQDGDPLAIGIGEFEAEEKIQMLQVKLEKLQEENAAEWQKCERLESEKSALERENKRLKIRILELEDVEGAQTGGATLQTPAGQGGGSTCNTGSTSSSSEGIGSMGTCGTGDLSGVAGNALPNSACAVQVNSNGQQMIITAGQAGSGIQSKIHQELAQAHQKYEKLKRVLQDKTVELGHALRRADAFEQEVKKLRSRIEELKAMLGAAQDELDSNQASVRKLINRNKELELVVNKLRQENTQLEAQSAVPVGTDGADLCSSTPASCLLTADVSPSSNEPSTGIEDESTEQPPEPAPAIQLASGSEESQKQTAHSPVKASISGPAWTSIFRPLVRPKRGSFPLAHLSPSAPTGSIQSPGIGTPGTPVLWTSPRTTLSGGNRPRQS